MEQHLTTEVYDVSQGAADAGRAIARAARTIREGGLVAFPTETVYGLGADALNADAVRRIFAVKGRPADNPLIVHVASVEQAKTLSTGWNEAAEKLAAVFWPGPLTIILPRKNVIPDIVTGGLATVGLRLPGHPVARELIRQADRPIAAPSGNLSGGPSPTRPEHVIDDLSDRVPIILTAGACRVGIESTVVDLSVEPPMILRPGIITAADMADRAGVQTACDPALNAPASFGAAEPKAPGMKYRHYAPKAEVVVLRGREERIRTEMARRAEEAARGGRKTICWMLGEASPEQAAYELFARLRDADAAGADLILAGAIDEGGEIGFAVMNRLLKSAGHHIIEV